MIIISALGSLNTTFEVRASEWALAFSMTSLAFITFANPALFDMDSFVTIVAMTRPMANALHVSIGTLWGVVFTCVGLGRLCMLLVNGAWWPTPHFRSLAAFCSCFIWFQITIGIALNFSWGLAIFPWLFLLDAYNALRAGHEAGVSQYLRRYGKEKNARRMADT